MIREVEAQLVACQVAGIDPRVYAPTMELRGPYKFLVARGILRQEDVEDAVIKAHVERMLFCLSVSFATVFEKEIEYRCARH